MVVRKLRVYKYKRSKTIWVKTLGVFYFCHDCAALHANGSQNYSLFICVGISFLSNVYICKKLLYGCLIYRLSGLVIYWNIYFYYPFFFG